MTIELIERIKRLEDHHSRQIDENRKLSRRLERIECKLVGSEETLHHPREWIKICNHGIPIIKDKITCTACY